MVVKTILFESCTCRWSVVVDALHEVGVVRGNLHVTVEHTLDYQSVLVD